jgi:septum formation protein
MAQRQRPALILSSASPRRKALLRKLGIPYTIQPSHVDETCAQRSPKRFVVELALRKAKATAQGLRAQPRPVFVLGADTVVVLGRKILGKPTDLKDAYRMLYRLSNSTHQVYTGVALVEAGGKRQWVAHAVTHVRMKKMPLDHILKYSSRHLDKAGAYAIQDRKDPYAQVVKGSYENVVGLPLEVTAALLRKAGFKIKPL